MRLDEITLFRLATSSPRAFELATGSSGLLAPAHDPKLGALRKILERSPESQAIIFCEFVGTVNYLEESLQNSRVVYSITGETPFFERRGLLEGFRRNPASVLIMTAVGSEGLDLQFCSKLVNYDLHWNPMILEQRIGRIDRVGQAKSDVEINNIVVTGSVDERVLAVLSKKLATIAQSVFAPQPILENISLTAIAPTEILLAGDEALVSEERKGFELINALAQSSRIKLDDYEVVNKIDPQFCDPVLLKELGAAAQQPPWLSDSRILEWTTSLQKAALGISEIFAAYS